jgi:hypothetical protein
VCFYFLHELCSQVLMREACHLSWCFWHNSICDTCFCSRRHIGKRVPVRHSIRIHTSQVSTHSHQRLLTHTTPLHILL